MEILDKNQSKQNKTPVMEKSFVKAFAAVQSLITAPSGRISPPLALEVQLLSELNAFQVGPWARLNV